MVLAVYLPEWKVERHPIDHDHDKPDYLQRKKADSVRNRGKMRSIARVSAHTHGGTDFLEQVQALALSQELRAF